MSWHVLVGATFIWGMRSLLRRNPTEVPNPHWLSFHRLRHTLPPAIRKVGKEGGWRCPVDCYSFHIAVQRKVSPQLARLHYRMPQKGPRRGRHVRREPQPQALRRPNRWLARTFESPVGFGGWTVLTSQLTTSTKELVDPSPLSFFRSDDSSPVFSSFSCRSLLVLGIQVFVRHDSRIVSSYAARFPLFSFAKTSCPRLTRVCCSWFDLNRLFSHFFILLVS